jgi:GT2 family glycosyltransferase
MQAGDELVPQALSCFVEYFARNPGCAVAYADDIAVSVAGEESANLKPNWSPTLEEHSPYVGRSALWRSSTNADNIFREQREPRRIIEDILRHAPHESVGHIRRALFRVPRGSIAQTAKTRSVAAIASHAAQITVIIPTRDRADLLAACVDSILAAKLGAADEILIIDNDSKERKTEALFCQLQTRLPNFRVLRKPQPFNFSALCNAAATDARGDFLVFLNNDTEVRSADWLEKMHSFAGRHDVGAVGAKLLFPNGRIQHQGVVLGMGGVAGHFGAHAPADADGWRQGGRVPHETSAVTAACLMVEKAKFTAIGGFDAENLPIDLNDIDLCLRLAKRGWRTICDSRIELLHRESASRGGGALRLQRVYERERAYFTRKWSRVIRDDPYFHPALSLHALKESLW